MGVRFGSITIRLSVLSHLMELSREPGPFLTAAAFTPRLFSSFISLGSALSQYTTLLPPILWISAASSALSCPRHTFSSRAISVCFFRSQPHRVSASGSRAKPKSSPMKRLSQASASASVISLSSRLVNTRPPFPVGTPSYSFRYACGLDCLSRSASNRKRSPSQFAGRSR